MTTVMAYLASKWQDYWKLHTRWQISLAVIDDWYDGSESRTK